MTTRAKPPGTHTHARAPGPTPERLFAWTAYVNILVSLAAFVFALALFVSAHAQFRMRGAVDNGGPAQGDGL